MSSSSVTTQTSSSSSADTSFEEGVAVQPLHQGNIRKPWAKKILQQGNYASPTDNIMSPCTKKLQAHKKRHYNKSKPQLLARTFNSVTTSNPETVEGNEENTPPASSQ